MKNTNRVRLGHSVLKPKPNDPRYGCVLGNLALNFKCFTGTKLAPFHRTVLRSLIFSFSFLIFSIASCRYTEAQQVGILSDIHGERELLDSALRSLNQLQIDHLILLGDIHRAADLDELHQILSHIRTETGIPASRIYFVPGNRDAPLGQPLPSDWAERISSEVRVLNTQTNQFSILNLDGFQMALSHFPIRPVPQDLLPSALERFNFSTWLSEENASNFVLTRRDFLRHLSFTVQRPSTNSSMAANRKPGVEVDLILFGHTHIPSFFFDQEIGVPVVNPGAFVDHPLNTFLTLDIPGRQIRYHEVGSEKVLLELGLNEIQNLNCQNLLKNPELRTKL